MSKKKQEFWDVFYKEVETQGVDKIETILKTKSFDELYILAQQAKLVSALYKNQEAYEINPLSIEAPMAKELLAYMEKHPIKELKGTYPLHWAIDKKHIEIAKDLIANGIDLNSQDEKGNTALHLAAYGGYAEIARTLIAKGANLNLKSKIGNTPLQAALFQGNVEIAKDLIEKGVDLDIQNREGRTALGNTYNYPEIRKALLKAGAKPTAGKNKELTQLYCDDKDIIELFKAAIDDNDLKTMGNLLKHNAHLKNKKMEGKTLLAYAVEKNNPQMIGYMAEQGFTLKGSWYEFIKFKLGFKYKAIEKNEVGVIAKSEELQVSKVTKNDLVVQSDSKWRNAAKGGNNRKRSQSVS